MTDKKPELPSAGGSYLVDAKGKLVQRERTIGPLDPDHPDHKSRRDDTVKES